MRPALLIVLASAPALLMALCSSACSSEDGASPTPDGGGLDASGSDVVTVDDAGDAGSTGAPVYASGTRLRAQLERAGGASRFLSFLDTTRAEACLFRHTSEAAMHCLPDAVDVVYTDAACTTPIAALTDCSATFKYAADVGTTADCANPAQLTRSIYTLGAVLPTADYYARAGDGRCYLEPAAPTTKLHALGAAVPLGAFVPASTALETVGTVQRTRARGADGSSVAGTPYADPVRKIACHPFRVGSSTSTETRCAPSESAFTDSVQGPFADSSCTARAGGSLVKAGCTTKAIRRADRDPPSDAGVVVCRAFFGVSYFEIGAPVATGYRLSGPACETDTTPGFAFHALGAPISAASMPEMTRANFGAGRMRLFAWTSGGAQIDPGSLLDEQFNDACFSEPFADGKSYCVPGGRVTQPEILTYKDAGCTQRVVLGAPCSAAIAVTGNPSCGGDAHGVDVYPVGPSFDLPTYYDGSGGTCVAMPNNNVGRSARDLLAPVNVATLLVPVTLVTE